MQKEEAAGDEDRIILEDGFSSEEEIQHEELQVEPVLEKEEESNHREEVLLKLPPPAQIPKKSYSLQPDIQTGWQNKGEPLPQPIPIIFEAPRYDHLIRRMLKNPRRQARVVYLGPRYENTYYSWYDKPFKFPYEHIKAPNDMKFTNRPFCGQHWEAEGEEELQFDSFFEGGNLDCVMRVGERQYDCFMRVDSNTAGHLHWFDFRVRGWKRLLKYKINICNFQKGRCLYARGMRPYVKSTRQQQKEGVGWHQSGENVRFQRRNITASRIYDFQMRAMYRLSFQLYSNYDDDQLQIAYCAPYTYTRLSQFLHKVSAKPQSKDYLKISKLCNSLGGLEVPLLIIHQGIQDEKQLNRAVVDPSDPALQKRCVIISGRAHPGESNGSHMMEGFIEWLCGNSKQAAELRRHVVFKIVPMLNPDGVALGNYRTGLSGRDFNREYRNPDKPLFPEVYCFKRLVSENKAIFGDRLMMFLDFHGHSTKKNTFVYGPEFPIIERFYYESRIFPKLLGNITSMFRYYSCIFKISDFKVTTARAILLRRLNVPLSYTIQTSNGSFFDYNTLKDIPYTPQKWVEMGKAVGEALKEYSDLLVSADRHRYQKMVAKKRVKERKQSSNSNKKNRKNLSAKISSERTSIFSALESQKIRHLFDEIKQAQENRGQDRMSDDEMSEGSSDREGEENDLSPEQASYLIDIIKKGKCESVSRCKIRRSKNQHNRTTEDLLKEASSMPADNKEEDNCGSEEVLARKKVINIRKPVPSRLGGDVANFQASSNSQRRSSGDGRTARIINFSFCSQSPRRRTPERGLGKMGIVSKLNFLELVSGKWSQDRGRKETRSKVVMDLSDNQFRRTFHAQAREQQRAGGNTGPTRGEIDPNQQAYLPLKRGRFQQYKYRRMLMHGHE